ncbi:DnaJ family domain-containing protein [Streptomyces sp. NPDC054904]|uniref:DnaJ family domain-containing protein n=1 Tax=Streptomyces sp. NPDC090054 TaxID=3365933 RepID=UPI00380F77D1
MTERKPPGVSFESFVDRQIREAEARGEFERLPGWGKPMASLDAPYDELWWIKGKMHREGFSSLPPALALRKEAEDALEAARAARTERQVRAVLTGVNEKIAAALRMPPPGPPLNLTEFDVEAVLAEWRAARPS